MYALQSNHQKKTPTKDAFNCDEAAYLKQSKYE